MRRRAFRQFDPAMQQAALFKTQMSDVLIVRMQDGKTREDCIAMMAVVINHIATIGRRGPDIFGQKIVLRPGLPVLMALGMYQVQALNLL